VGTASSIYIAAPILLLLGEKRLRREIQPAATGTGRAVPR
jgi:preprotein translocase subunit SecF